MTSTSKRIFLVLPKNENEDSSFFEDARYLISKTRKCLTGDILHPLLYRHFEEFDNVAVSFIGQNKDQIGFVDQHADDHVTNIYCYKCTDGELTQVIEASIENIVGSRSFDNKILLPDWRCCLLFSKDRLSLAISALTCGQHFLDMLLKNDILVLDECRRTSRIKMCVSDARNLLAVVQPYSGPVYSSLTIDCIQMVGGDGSSANSTIRLTHLLRNRIEIRNPNLLDCHFVCDGRKLILITDSPSDGNVFICCSVSPFLKLFTTKVPCNRQTKGWFFFRWEEPDDRMMTVHDVYSNEPDAHEKVFEVFSFVDDRTLIPLKRFTLTSLGLDNKLASHTSVSSNFLFITNSVRTIMLDIVTQSLVYVLQLNPVGHEYFSLSDVTVRYNGVEIFICRVYKVSEMNKVRAKVVREDGSGRESRSHMPRNIDGEEIEQETIQVNEVIETHLDIFNAPQPLVTLFSLCRRLVLKLCSNENDLARLPIPGRLKDDLLSVRS